MSEIGNFPDEPTRQEIDQLAGPVVLVFGAAWCEYCRALAPGLTTLLESRPNIRHINIEDGPGRPLGRSFRVKLWPTLIFMKDGQILKQLSRPEIEEVREGLQAIAGDQENPG